MTEAEYQTRLAEVEPLLNDPSIPFDAGKIWSLLSEMAQYTAAQNEKAKGP